jgi:methionine-rich copper-binding protein CopC
MRLGITLTLVAASLASAGAAYVHLTLIDSRPKEASVIAESPPEIWLRFNQRLDLSKSSIAMRGPGGAVKLDKPVAPDSLAMSAKLKESLGPGEYTVSWLATPYEDHAVRGRYKFTVREN